MNRISFSSTRSVAMVNDKGNILHSESNQLSLHMFSSSILCAFADCLYYTDMPPPSDIVKVAIEWPGANAQLIEMDQVWAAFSGANDDVAAPQLNFFLFICRNELCLQ